MKDKWFYYFKVSRKFFAFLKNKDAKKSKKIAVFMLMLFALAYLIMPVDLVPDLIPVLGYFEDGTILVAMLTLIGHIIDNEEIIIQGEKNDYVDEQETIIDVDFIDVED